MSVELKANYYTGIKPQAFQATVWLEPGQFHIKFIKGDQEEERSWDVKKIKPNRDVSDSKFILQYGVSHPFEFLEFNDPDSLSHLRNYYPEKNWNQKSNVFSKNPLKTAVTAVGIFIIIGIAAYFFLVPGIAGLISKNVPVKWELQLGDKMYKGLIPENHEDKIKSRMLDTFFIMLDISSQYPIRFHFINDSVVNAFAMPGGNIVIYKGLFDKIQTYESLTGLIGHEFTHIENKHSLKTIFRSISSFVLLSAFFGDLTGLAGVILQNANSIQNLAYSREFEREADANAVNLMLERKIGLTGMLDLFKVLLMDENKDLEVPKFLSTHPVTEDRIQYVKSKMGQKEGSLVHYENLLQLFNRLKQR